MLSKAKSPKGSSKKLQYLSRKGLEKRAARKTRSRKSQAIKKILATKIWMEGLQNAGKPAPTREEGLAFHVGFNMGFKFGVKSVPNYNGTQKLQELRGKVYKIFEDAECCKKTTLWFDKNTTLFDEIDLQLEKLISDAKQENHERKCLGTKRNEDKGKSSPVAKSDLLENCEQTLDMFNAEYGTKDELCLCCGAKEYNGDKGILHKKDCLILRLRKVRSK